MSNHRNLSIGFVSSLLLTGTVAASNLVYVSSYSGVISTLNLTTTAGRINQLTPIKTSNGCAANPSWLTLDRPNAVMYCTDEGFAGPDGSLSSFRTNSDGSLTRLGRIATLGGPVSGVKYGEKGRGFALAHYGGSGVTTWDISNPSQLKAIETKKFKLDKPGADPGRQEAPHPHQSITDPSGKFVLVPDLGSDSVRVFSVNCKTLALKDLPALNVKPGSGPRHVTFAVKNNKTFMYLVTELANTIIGYEVTYPAGSIKFQELFTIGTHGKGKPTPAGAAASEIIVSPDNKFLIVSQRAENQYRVPNFNPNISEQIISDPLINFSIEANGNLNLIQEVAAGGRFPRQFSINKAGNLLAVGLQKDGRVVFIKRNVQTGMLGEFVAYSNIEGEITTAIFDE